MIKRGLYTYGNPIILGEKSKVITGKYCSISDTAKFDCGAQHNSDFITTFPLNQKITGCQHLDFHPKTNGDIIIGNDVWIADEAMIMSGVTIGDGAIVAAGAIVTHDVRPYEVVGGVPARVIRVRYSPAVRSLLLKIKWWDWPNEKIIENAHLLMSNNIDEFLNKHSHGLE